MKRTITIYDTSDIAINVTGEFTPACRGKRDEFGAQLEPDTDEELEIINVEDEHGERDLTPKQIERAEWALWEAAAQ